MADTQEKDPTYYMPEIFKKWHKYGFISIRYWPGGDKIQIEIGDVVDANGSKTTKQVTKCYVDVWEFQSYLHAEVNNNLLHIMPKFGNDSWKVYGGSKKSQPIVSRVFTAAYWKNKDGDVDTSGRAFQCAHYEGVVGSNGEINPNFSKAISFNYIRLAMFDLAKMYHTLCALINAYAIQKADQVVVFDDE